MTKIIPMKNGAEKLYEENVTPRNSLAFNIGMVILGKIFKGIGIGIDKVTGWLPLPIYTNDGNEKQPTRQSPTAIYDRMATSYNARVIPIDTHRNNEIKSEYNELTTDYNARVISIDEYIASRKPWKVAA